MKTLLMIIGGLVAIYQSFLFNGSSQQSESFTTSKSAIECEQFKDEQPLIIHGHVRRPEGTPISGASVALYLTGYDTPVYTGTTDSNGGYSASSLASGNYTLNLSATGFVPKSVGINLQTNIDRIDTLDYQ